MNGEKYYSCMEGSMQGEIELTGSEIKMNIKMNIPSGGCGESGQIGTGARLGTEWVGTRLEWGRWDQGPDWGLGGPCQMEAGTRLGPVSGAR